MRNVLRRLAFHQISRPRGWVAPITARFLNRVNADHNRAVLANFSGHEGQIVLELGFGGGPTLDPLLHGYRSTVIGVDPSMQMLKRARRRFRNEADRGRLMLMDAVAEELPVRSQSVDAVISVHSIYYWNDWRAGLREVTRILAPDGVLLLGIGAKANKHAQTLGLDRIGFRAPSFDDIRDSASQVGLSNIQIEMTDDFGVLVGRR